MENNTMRKILFILFVIIFIVPVNAINIWSDDFTDGDYTNNPLWSACNVNEFYTIENFKLNHTWNLDGNSCLHSNNTMNISEQTEISLSVVANITFTNTSNFFDFGLTDGSNYGGESSIIYLYVYRTGAFSWDVVYDVCTLSACGTTTNINSTVNDNLPHKYEIKYNTTSKKVTILIDNIETSNYTDSDTFTNNDLVYSRIFTDEGNFDDFILSGNGWSCTGSPCDTYAAKNGSDNFTAPANFTITNAAYIDEGNTDVNYGSADNLTVFYNNTIYINKSVLLDLGPNALTNTMDVYVYQRSGVGSESLTSYNCTAFNESNVTWASFYANNTCNTYGTQIWSNASGWNYLSFQNVRYVLINTTTGQDNYVWESDDNVSYAPYVVFSEATEQNDCLSWSTACLNISRAEALVDDYGTTHIGYGNYSAQPAMNGSMVKPIEYFCDSAGYQENVSEPWCDMPGVNSS